MRFYNNASNAVLQQMMFVNISCLSSSAAANE